MLPINSDEFQHQKVVSNRIPVPEEMAPSMAQDAVGAGSIVSTRVDSFHKLIADLSNILGPSSGINSLDIDVRELQSLMENYVSCESEWTKYVFSDSSRGYTRNLVDEGNGKSNVLVLVWTPGKGSPIHDHADAHCLMKVLKGSLRETRFDFPKNAITPPAIIKETDFGENQVTYMNDDLGLHKISNPDPKNMAFIHRPMQQEKAATSLMRELARDLMSHNRISIPHLV